MKNRLLHKWLGLFRQYRGEQPSPIPFNRPYISGREVQYMEAAMKRGHCSGNGHYTQQCESLLQNWFGAPRVLLTPSGTGALEMAAYLLQINPGDEVIVPAFTFVSTANAFVSRGARPVFADIDPETLNLDPVDVARKLSPKTRAIVPVHYGGVACDMEKLVELAELHDVTLVEDNAHGLFGTYRGRPLGSFGALSTVSFHETKNFSCGEGGALVVGDPALVRRAEVLRDKGTDRARFFRGEVAAYTWQDHGSNYLLSDLQAAFLLAQLEEREKILAKRKRLWLRYYEELQPWAEESGVRFIEPLSQGEGTHHVFPLVFPSQASSREFLAESARQKIHSIFHYQPLNLSPMGESFGASHCPQAESIAERLVRLPLYTGMTEAEQGRVISWVHQFGGASLGSSPIPRPRFLPSALALESDRLS